MDKSDGQLLGEFVSGDRDSYVTIYHRHKHKIYEYCFRLLEDEDEAKDVLQTVFVRLFEHGDEIEQPERLRAWLYCVTRNICMDRLRSRTRNKAAEAIALESYVSSTHCTNEANIARGLSAMIRRCLQLLSPELREILILREYQDFTYKEIAEIASINEGTVKFRLFTARKKLSELLLPAMKGAAKNEL